MYSNNRNVCKSLSRNSSSQTTNDSIPQSENLALSLNSWNQNSREYDDTLRLLRKENFNLKLRIYFLEERFSKIQDNCSVLNNWDSEFNEQNMYQRNIDLEIENNELKIEIQQKQELLLQAARAIESMKVSMPNPANTDNINIFTEDISLKQKHDKQIEELKIQINDFKRTIADKLCVIQDLEDQIISKNKAHERGCRTIQHLLGKIRYLDMEIVKLKTKIKDYSTNNFIVQQKTFEMGNNKEKQEICWRSELRVLCNMLACRLNELAGFLNSLLKNDGIINTITTYQRDEIREAVNKSLNLSRDVCVYQDNISSSEDILNEKSAYGLEVITVGNTELLMKTIGHSYFTYETASENPSTNGKHYLDQIYSNSSGDCRQSKNDSNIFIIEYERFCQKYFSNKILHLNEGKEMIKNEIESIKGSCKSLLNDMLKDFKAIIKNHRSMFVHETVHYKQLKNLEYLNEELEKELSLRDELLKTIRKDLKCSKSELFETNSNMVNLKRRFDETLLQVSRAVLERTKCMSELENMDILNKLLQKKVDSQLIDISELHTKLAMLRHENAQLHNKLVFIESNKKSGEEKTENSCSSEHINNRTNQLKNIHQFNVDALVKQIIIEPDETECDNVNQNIQVKHDCNVVEQQNIELKRRLEKSKKMFQKTWMRLRLSNQRKEQIENDIRHEIYKTHNVLKNVKYNFEKINPS